jgi:hypothetical protein
MLMAGTAVRVGGALHLENAGGFANLHPGRFVVVKGEELVGTYEAMDLALAAGASAFGLDCFLVRKLGEEEQEIRVPALRLLLPISQDPAPAPAA